VQVAHIEDEVGPKVLDKLVVSLGSGRNDLITGKLGQLDCVLSNRRAPAINEELHVLRERMSSFGSQIFPLTQVPGAGGVASPGWGSWRLLGP